MFGLTPLFFYIGVALIASNVLFAGMWKYADLRADKQEALVMKCAADHRAFKDQVESSGRIAQAQAKQKEAEHEKLAEDTAKGWAAAVAVVRADAAQRVRNAAKRSAGSGAMPQISADRPGATVPESDSIPSPARVAADCAETTVTANFLQDYIERLERLSP